MKTFTVKNVTFGSGIPKIAVPLTDDRPEELIKSAAAARSEADLVELRIDPYLARQAEETGGPGELTKLLAGVRAAFDGPVLFTLRTAAEGGLYEVTDAKYREILAEAAESGCVDLLDIEFARETAAAAAEDAAKAGIPVVFSQHDFKGTPGADAILGTFLDMERAGGAIAKGACMPENGADVDEVIRASGLAGEQLSIPFILIAMGEKGRITRTHGEIFGSCLTFASLGGRASAPGQIGADVMRAELGKIHEAGMRKGFIFLIGFMGTGKSACARAIRRNSGLPVLEMDETIEERQGMPVSRIFKTQGEEAFRDMETELLESLYGQESAVVSCGGGVVLRERNRRLMRGLGTIVLLTASPETIYSRLQGKTGNRPNIRDRFSVEGIRELMEVRRAAYMAAADVMIPTDGLSPRKIAEKILSERESGNFV